VVQVGATARTRRRLQAPRSSAVRRENRDAKGAEGVSPSPLGDGLGKGQLPSSEFFLILDLKMMRFGAFCVYFLQQRGVFYTQNSRFGASKT